MDVDSRCFSSSCWTSFAFIHPFIHGSDFKWCYLWWKFDRWLLFMYINRLVASVYFYWYVQKLPLMLRKFINIWLYTTNINWLTRTQKINASPPTGNEQKKKMAKGSDGLFVYLYVWRNGPALVHLLLLLLSLMFDSWLFLPDLIDVFRFVLAPWLQFASGSH